jgi:hypothetical protein
MLSVNMPGMRAVCVNKNFSNYFLPSSIFFTFSIHRFHTLQLFTRHPYPMLLLLSHSLFVLSKQKVFFFIFCCFLCLACYDGINKTVIITLNHDVYAHEGSGEC